MQCHNKGLVLQVVMFVDERLVHSDEVLLGSQFAVFHVLLQVLKLPLVVLYLAQQVVQL